LKKSPHLYFISGSIFPKNLDKRSQFRWLKSIPFPFFFFLSFLPFWKKILLFRAVVYSGLMLINDKKMQPAAIETISKSNVYTDIIFAYGQGQSRI